MDTIIAVDHLHKRYGDTIAVDDVSFDVRRGEIFGLLGPNGAGKTTTVECLLGLRRRTSGTVRVLGHDPDSERRRLLGHIGSQLQSCALPERVRVGEALELFAAACRAPVDIDAVLDAWSLRALRRRPYAVLSGGQRQRLFLALALLGDPEVVVLDELTTGLDPHARRSTWDLVRGVRERGATVVLVTHFMEEAEVLCDRIAIVNDGRVVALDTPAALVSARGQRMRMTFTSDGHDVGFLCDVPGVVSVDHDGTATTVVADGPAAIPVAAALANHDVHTPDFRTHHPSLEDVFLTTTGRSLRD